MKPTYLVLGGYGEMGRVIVHDLFETTKDKIIVAGHDKTAAQKFAETFKNKRVASAGIDVRDTHSLAALIKKSSIVINATQYTRNLDVMKAAEIARRPYLDLGGLFHMTKKQLKLHKRWKKKNLLAVLGCGSTPGITNVLAAHGASLLDRVKEIHIRFADYDPAAKKMRFAFPYSIATVFDEFTKEAAVLKRGKLTFVPAMTEKEHEKFPRPIGEVTEYHTLHSELATFPAAFKKKGIRECSFKVSFAEDFIRDIKMFIGLGLNKPQHFPLMQKIAGLNASHGSVRDFEYVRVRMVGTRKEKTVLLILDCVTRSKPEWQAAAGAYDTGVPPSIIAQMIVKGKIPHTGVLPPEKCIDPQEFFRELRKRGMKIKVTDH